MLTSKFKVNNLPGIPSLVLKLIIFFSIIGTLDASYLTFKYYTKSELYCSFFSGCDTVTNSQYSEIFGIPVALIGLIYYLSVFIISLLLHKGYIKKIDLYFTCFTAIGFIASMWFMYLQFFVLSALCIYCIMSAISSTLIFALTTSYTLENYEY